MPFALDFGAVMMMGTALGVDVQLLADVLPAVEQAVIDNLIGDEPDAVE